MIEKLTNRVNKKGTRSHGHICLQPFLTHRETLNYLRVAAKDWAIPLSSTQAAFSFSAFREKGHSSVPQTDPPAQDIHRVLYCTARCANTNVREEGKNWGAMTILVFLCCIFQFFVLSFFCGRRGRLVVDNNQKQTLKRQQQKPRQSTNSPQTTTNNHKQPQKATNNNKQQTTTTTTTPRSHFGSRLLGVCCVLVRKVEGLRLDSLRTQDVRIRPCG